MQKNQDTQKPSTPSTPYANVTAEQIKADLPVVGSNGRKFAEVDHMQGSNSIKLKKDQAGVHHYIPLSWVKRCEGKLELDRSAEDAMRDWSERAPGGGQA
ncbi:MAG: DUF2171 domain-containing protein [Kofleriaceae bacterium]